MRFLKLGFFNKLPLLVLQIFCEISLSYWHSKKTPPCPGQWRIAIFRCPGRRGVAISRHPGHWGVATNELVEKSPVSVMPGSRRSTVSRTPEGHNRESRIAGVPDSRDSRIPGILYVVLLVMYWKKYFLQIGKYGYQKMQNFTLISNPRTKLIKKVHQ